ncbi:MAG: rod shape-determining protein MreC [Alistipes sp.]|nr:rod shape-determining protein MreC [Alistipes sp.]
MYRLLLFLRRIYVFAIFGVLEGLALHYYANSTMHTRARLLGLSDRMVGGVYEAITGAGRYMSLGSVNRLLEDKVVALENELAVFRDHYSQEALDSIRMAEDFRHQYVTARVVHNSINKRENFFTVDRGTRDGVERGMAVVSLDGYMVGYVEGVSAGNAICVSVLNTAFRASGMFAASGHFGSVSWPGVDPRTVRLSEVPKYAPVSRGDTIITRSSLNFPEGIFIGRVENFTVDEARASYEIDVALGVDVAALRVVMLVKNLEAFERLRLEEEVIGVSEE